MFVDSLPGNDAWAVDPADPLDAFDGAAAS